MTIDERLAKLAERHESLTHAVELLTRMHGDTEDRFARHEDLLGKMTERFAERFGRHEELLAKIEQRFADFQDVLSQIVNLQREQASKILTHAKLLTEHDERMERVGRHLE